MVGTNEKWTLILPETSGIVATTRDIDEKISAAITGNFAQLDNKDPQTFTGLNHFTQPTFFSIANANSAAHSNGTISIYQTDATDSYSNTNTIYVDKIVIADQKAKVSATFGNGYIKRNGYTYKFPQKDGDDTLALLSDVNTSGKETVIRLIGSRASFATGAISLEAGYQNNYDERRIVAQRIETGDVWKEQSLLMAEVKRLNSSTSMSKQFSWTSGLSEEKSRFNAYFTTSSMYICEVTGTGGGIRIYGVKYGI